MGSIIAMPVWLAILLTALWGLSLGAAIWFGMARGFAFGVQKHEQQNTPLAITNGETLDKNEKFKAVKA